MADFPEEIWSKILKMGVRCGGLSYKDLCCLSISCRRLDRLSKDPILWSILIEREFPSNSSSLGRSSNVESDSLKGLFKTKYERDKTQKHLAYRRVVLRAESQIFMTSSELKRSWLQLEKEQQRMQNTSKELKSLKRARQASVALNVWQPEIVRSSHRQIVEQSPVDVHSRINALEMEVKVCFHQIRTLVERNKKLQKQLESNNDHLASLKYHPLRNYEAGIVIHEHREHKVKKLKKVE